MKYAIQINGAPGRSPAVQVAHEFIKAVLAAGHEVNRVFFYHDGVYNGFNADRKEPLNFPDWSALAHRHGLDLVLCVSAAERRGLAAGLPAPGFRFGGLGQWMEACLQADRVLVF